MLKTFFDRSKKKIIFGIFCAAYFGLVLIETRLDEKHLVSHTNDVTSERWDPHSVTRLSELLYSEIIPWDWLLWQVL